MSKYFVEKQLCEDIPADLLQLARRIQRDCTAPGNYLIQYVVPVHPKQPRRVVIARSESIRDFEVQR